VRPPLIYQPQALAYLGEEHAVRHPVMTRGRRRPGARQQTRILFDSLRQRGRYTDAARALREPLSQLLAFLEIGVDDHLLLAGKRLSNRLGVHVGVAIHVATDP